MSESEFDVLVAGGGPAGMAAAITLARRSPLRTLIADGSRNEMPRAGETLSPGAQGLLEYLGVLEPFLADGHLPSYGTAAAWGQASLRTRDFIRTPFGTGFHLDRRRFDARLAEAADRAGATVWPRSRVVRLHRIPSSPPVHATPAEPVSPGQIDRAGDAVITATVDRDGRRVAVRVRFVIDATGRASGLTVQLGGHRRWLDRQVAVLRTIRVPGGTERDRASGAGDSADGRNVGLKPKLAVVSPATGTVGRLGELSSGASRPPALPSLSSLGSTPIECQTLVEACPTGWWYSSCVPDGSLVVGMITDGDLVPGLGILDEAIWDAELARTTHTAERVAGGRATGPPRATSAGSGCLGPMSGPSWVAVGDAAASHDPLSASGIVRALDSGIYGARAVAATLGSGRGDELVAYERRMLDGFQQFVATWRRYYALEQRFPDSPYWRRRQRTVRLHPRVELARTAKPGSPQLPLDLGRIDGDRLLALCTRPRQAHDVVAHYGSPMDHPVPDSELILALQWLAGEGWLTSRAMAS